MNEHKQVAPREMRSSAGNSPFQAKQQKNQDANREPDSSDSDNSMNSNRAIKSSDSADKPICKSGLNSAEVQPVYSKTDSPMQLSKESLEEAQKGVMGDPASNELFDPNFYKNLVATRQHNLALRPLPDSSSAPKPSDVVEEHRVRARRVQSNGEDSISKIVVTQTEYCGSGVFSDVYKGFVVDVNDKNHAKQVCAIKKLWPDPSKEDRQISVWRKFDHENLVKILYYYVCIHPKSKVSMWTLLMQLMPSTVAIEQSKYILRGKVLPVIYAKLWMYQTLAGLSYMERKGYMHLDIKPDNLLVDKETGRLKIGDFGSTKEYSKSVAQNWYQVTRYYRAPELCFKFMRFDPTVDVWAAGCILIEMLTNRIIFFGNNNDDQLLKIFKVIGTPTIEQLSQCIPEHHIDSNLLKKKYPPADWNRILLRYNQSVSKHCVDLIERILRYECNKRLRGREALNHKYFSTIKDPRAKLPNGAPLPALWYGSN
ncbi:hypothetical protein L596_018831 [Steinernema carpocapsae]|uniref:Protein kinase domain-containing protein n=1 Tax=Steinernema carpocapsae TaxID=34508 RepID=A0A4U5N6B0_STECR|nr:hypothetical protein L596_018831 [Steinernema carpocapsae]